MAMTPVEHADIWKKVSDRMEAYADRKGLPTMDVCVLASLALFAFEVSQAYRLKAAAEKHPEAFKG